MKHLGLITLTILGLSVSTNGLVKFYDSLSFEGLFHQMTPNENCTNLPGFGHNIASSLKTDQCFFAYTAADCGGSSIKIPPGDYPDLKEVRRSELNFDNVIIAVRACTDSNGGPRLNVVLRTNYAEEATTIVSFSDICGCYNLPLYAIGKVNGLTNGGNCVKLHSELECLGSSVEIEGGAGAETGNLTFVGFNGNTKSVSGCGVTSTCARLTASVSQIALSADPAQIPSPEFLEMPSNASYSNNGNATVEEEYHSVKEVNQVLEIFRDSALVSLYRVSVSSSLSVENSIGHPFFDKKNLGYVLNEGFTLSQNANQRFIHNETREFNVNEKIQVPPCSMYSIAAYVKSYENFPVDYQLTLQISGVSGDRKLFTDELRGRLSDGLEYIRDQDEYTVIARVNGTLNASFGIEAFTQGQGKAIPQC